MSVEKLLKGIVLGLWCMVQNIFIVLKFMNEDIIFTCNLSSIVIIVLILCNLQ